VIREIQFDYDNQKSVEVLLYISQRLSNIYYVLKVLYFADKKHLERYGRFITGDRYVAMEKGPVPSGAYDIVKDVRDRRTDSYDSDFRIVGNKINILRKPNTELLSISDIQCLDEAIEEISPLSFDEVRRKSHDDAYRAADENDFISVEDIINTLPCKDALLKHLTECG